MSISCFMNNDILPKFSVKDHVKIKETINDKVLENKTGKIGYISKDGYICAIILDEPIDDLVIMVPVVCLEKS